MTFAYLFYLVHSQQGLKHGGIYMFEIFIEQHGTIYISQVTGRIFVCTSHTLYVTRHRFMNMGYISLISLQMSQIWDYTSLVSYQRALVTSHNFRAYVTCHTFMCIHHRSLKTCHKFLTSCHWSPIHVHRLQVTTFYAYATGQGN